MVSIKKTLKEIYGHKVKQRTITKLWFNGYSIDDAVEYIRELINEQI